MLKESQIWSGCASKRKVWGADQEPHICTIGMWGDGRVVSGGGGDFSRTREPHFGGDKRETLLLFQRLLIVLQQCSMHVGFIPNPRGSCFWLTLLCSWFIFDLDFIFFFLAGSGVRKIVRIITDNYPDPNKQEKSINNKIFRTKMSSKIFYNTIEYETQVNWNILK